jgi:hypothetical protein
VHAPCSDDDRGVDSETRQVTVVVRFDRIRGSPKVGRSCGAEREEICDADGTVAPVPCEVDASAYRRVVVRLVGGARIERHEQRRASRFVPLAPE